MNQLCHFFLLFGKEIGVALVFLIGYFFYSKKIFFHAIVLAISGMVVAAFLKSIFKIPLMSHVGEGWAFPSGHMFVAATFWGFLAIEIRNRFFSLIAAIILVGVAVGLLYFNYHQWIDLVAAGAFAFIFIAVFRLLLNMPICYNNQAFLSFLMLGICFLLVLSLPKTLLHLKIALSILLGLAIGTFLLSMFNLSKKTNNIVEFILCLAGAILIYYLSFFVKNFSTLPISILHTILGLWVIVGPKLIVSLLGSSRKKG